MSSNIAIKVDNLAKVYHQYAKPSSRLTQWFYRGRKHLFQEYIALKPLSFDLPKGSVLGVVGQNGAGKSTLLQLLCGTLRPSSGNITVNGRIAALLELGSGFNPEFTGRENVYLNGSILGLSQKEIEQGFNNIVTFAGIGDFIDQPVKTYSSGMMVRLAFAVATSVKPDILIVDEALSVGDGAFARKSFERIMELKAKGTTILFCSHNLYQIEAICDHALWLHKGEMIALGRPAEVVKQYESFLYQVDGNPNAPKALDTTSEASSSSSLPKFLDMTITLDGKPCSLTEVPTGISSLCDLSISANWHCGQESEAVFAATIHASDSRMVASASSQIDGLSLACHQGKASCQLTFDQLPLLKGEYWVEVYLLCDQGIQFFDQRIPAARFKIEQPDYSLEQGLVHLSRKWS